MARIPLLFLPIVVAAGATAACGGSAPRDAGDSEARVPRPPAAYIVGRDAYGVAPGRVRLQSAPVAPLAGWLTPVAVPSPDRRRLLYNAWMELREDDPELSWEDQGIEPGDPLARPSLRLLDRETGEDVVFAEGAFSAAWRTDGALAYLRGTEPEYRAGVPYAGDVVVRSSLDAPPEAWSPEPGRFVVAGWAGAHLLAHRIGPGEALDVVSFDGPSRMRVLARDAALVAVSPDGRRAAVERGPAEGIPALLLVDVATGRETAALDLTKVDPSVGAIGYSGDWYDDLIVATSESGLAVFRVAGDRVVLEGTIPVDETLAEPRFADGTDRVTAWTSTPDGDVFVDCDRAARSCGRAVPGPDTPGVGRFPAWRRPLYNPSRPLEGER